MPTESHPAHRLADKLPASTQHGRPHHDGNPPLRRPPDLTNRKSGVTKLKKSLEYQSVTETQIVLFELSATFGFTCTSADRPVVPEE
jgi:hypothetical protein